MPIKPHTDYRLNKPFTTSIIEITEENSLVKTFKVKYDPIQEPIDIRPGQFVMVWIPGVDEIPMSVSHILEDGYLTISVANVGEATQAISNLRVGDPIGIRGPYGNWYLPKPGVAIVIGGGIGMASVLPLIYQLHHLQMETNSLNISRLICIQGAKTESQLLFTEELEKILNSKESLQLCTDDGTCGFKGFTTEKLQEILKEELILLKDTDPDTPITVYSCGPEIMLKKVVDICNAHHIEVQVSLERMMRCGFGICGLCALEPTGLLVCRDGPIFNGENLKDCTDFGKIHREFSGKPYSI